MALVLGVDPGFASIGVALLSVEAEKVGILEVMLLRTAKSDAKRKVLAADDNVRRCREIAHSLGMLVRTSGVRAICAESMSAPRNASAAAKVAMAWGVLVTLATSVDLPILQASPQEVKLAVSGIKSASKEQMQAILCRKYPELESMLMEANICRSEQEHPCDAVASVIACLNSEVLRMLRKEGR